MKKSKITCDLKSCSFCKLCVVDWLPVLDIKRQSIQIKKGETFIKEGEIVNGVYFVYQGAVKVHKEWGDKELIIRFAKKGDIVGHRGLGKDEYYPISATAMEPATVCFIPHEFFMSSLKINQDFLFQLMMFFAEELKVSEQKMRNMAHMPVKGRIALALLTLQEKFGLQENGFINLTLSKQDLASYTGATYETVFRLLNELEKENLVQSTGKQFQVLNEKKLKMISSRPA
jgi:CRP/FNR family transcriptional regulator